MMQTDVKATHVEATGTMVSIVLVLKAISF
jgi:hypothetical protein